MGKQTHVTMVHKVDYHCLLITYCSAVPEQDLTNILPPKMLDNNPDSILRPVFKLLKEHTKFGKILELLIVHEGLIYSINSDSNTLIIADYTAREINS